MILVTLGTQKQPFKRLLEYIENSNIKEEIIVQNGFTKFESKKMKLIGFTSYEEMDNLVDKASLIITHGGTGSIIGPLKKNKKIIACSRLSKYKEHVDDHQQELVGIFADEGYILELNESTNLSELIKLSETFKPRRYKSNVNNFMEKLSKLIESK